MIVAVRDYVDLLAGLGWVFSTVGAVAGGVAGSDEYTRGPAGAGVNIRRRLVTRYRAHPRLMSLSFACYGAASILLVAALVLWLA